MKNSPSQLALRQWRAQFSNPVTLLFLGGVAALLAILGPFETDFRLTLAPRFAYWLAMAAATYSVGLVINTWCQHALPSAYAIPVRLGVAAGATGLAVTPVVVALNYLTFGYVPEAGDWTTLLMQFFAISLIISVLFHAIGTTLPDDAAGDRTPALLERLPLDKRGPLVALSSEDHYTRIRTTRGEELILIRLSDAIREAEPTPGLKVHRSHWVALDQVQAAARDGDRAVLTVTGGGDIPVSRANVGAIKDAGLLPQ
ncbi:LytTR family DNA-binding domain-containing protein [Jannaschia sp. CCS1]|uniref:LytTR family DNA-binding domain-containing protein n=1 Tax=Jannaschia sp. (strain CCS1) TaxID=290400 RepID=UPI00031B36A5|nr:LytTR family DNA-binding domain-containing protein [Jannaschia sp. CCS1]